MITADQLEILENAADDLRADLRADYSGRGMYGKACVGFDLDRGTGPAEFAMRLAMYLVDNGEEDLAELMSEDVAQDSMGLGSIVYFPRVQAPREEEEADELEQEAELAAEEP